MLTNKKIKNFSNSTQDWIMKTNTASFVKSPMKFLKTNLNFDFWQRFSKTLLAVVAVMPIAGILISVGRLFGPGFIEGIDPGYVDHGLYTFGSIIESMGWFIIGNLGPLFAISIAGQWAKDKSGGAFSGFLLYALFNTVVFIIAKGMWESVNPDWFTTVTSANTFSFMDGSSSVPRLIDSSLHETLFQIVSNFKDNTDNAILESELIKMLNIEFGIELVGINPTDFTPGVVDHISNTGLLTDTTLGITTIKGVQVFSGIILGFVAGNAYNKYSTFNKLPGALSFFNGSRFVPFVIASKAVFYATIFAIIWPWISQGINSVGSWLANAGGTFYAPFIYGTAERALLPFGLHHMITQPMNYTPVGAEYYSLSAGQYGGGQDPLWLLWIGDVSFFENILGIKDAANMTGDELWGALENDQTAFARAKLKYDELVNNPNIGKAFENTYSSFEDYIRSWTTIVPARFKIGQVVNSTTLLPAMAVAFYLNVPVENRSKAFSVYVSAATSIAVAGITEPIEFMFAFVSPIMWAIYSVFVGFIWGFSDLINLSSVLGLRIHAFGIIELIARLPLILVTSLWKDFVVFVLWATLWGLLGFVTFYYITKWQKPLIPGITPISDFDESLDVRELGVVATPRSYALVEAYGGAANIVSVDNCMTRLRIKVKDIKKVSEESISKLGSQGIIKKGSSIQAIFGLTVEQVKIDFEKALEYPKNSEEKIEAKIVKPKTTKINATKK